MEDCIKLNIYLLFTNKYRCITTMNIQESLIEASNLIHSARLVIAAWEADPDDYSDLKQALTELRDEFKRVDDL